MDNNKIIFTILFFLIVCLNVNAQEMGPERWEETIQKFEKADDENPPEEGAALFVGSSSIAMWQDIENYFPGHKVLNRGFGGSEFSDLLYYADRVIFPYKPSKIFIYEGDNDVAAGKKPKEIVKQAQKLRQMIARELPEVPVVFISPKPSVARWELKEQYEAVNERLKKYAAKTDKTMFADVWTAMLDEEGQVYDHIFLEDNLHMNSEGYEIWQSVLAPYLKGDKKN